MRERTSEECLSTPVQRVQIGTVLHEQSNHLVQTCHLGMKIENQRMTPLVAGAGKLWIIAEQGIDALHTPRANGIENRGERKQVVDDVLLLAVVKSASDCR